MQVINRYVYVEKKSVETIKFNFFQLNNTITNLAVVKWIIPNMSSDNRVVVVYQ